MGELSGKIRERVERARFAGTIADLAEPEKIETAHLAEAIQYSPRDAK